MEKEITKEEWKIIKVFRVIQKYRKRIKLSSRQKKELWGIRKMGD